MLSNVATLAGLVVLVLGVQDAFGDAVAKMVAGFLLIVLGVLRHIADERPPVEPEEG